jgi:hypothetical protein
MRSLSGSVARLLGLFSLIAALLGPALPGHAAATPAEPGAVHAAMGCGEGAADDHRQPPVQTPAHHVPGAIDCCVANSCAMTLALPAVPSAVAIPAAPKAAPYSPRATIEPADIDSAPIPHPPKAA